jgi:hypothetical protein
MQDIKFDVINNKLDTVINNYDVISQDNRSLYTTVNRLEMVNARLEKNLPEKTKALSLGNFSKEQINK